MLRLQTKTWIEQNSISIAFLSEQSKNVRRDYRKISNVSVEEMGKGYGGRNLLAKGRRFLVAAPCADRALVVGGGL
jgi:hypothetical protein